MARLRSRVRFALYVETENGQETVPVRQEEVRVEREPITEDSIDQAMSGPAIGESEHAVTLHSEEPVVEKRTVSKERVRLDMDVHAGEDTVGGEVRRERIEGDGEAEGREATP